MPQSVRTGPGRHGRGLCTGLTALIAILLSLPAGGATGQVSITTPRNLATVLGPSTIELDVRTGTGVTAVDVEVYVDGKLLTTLSREPWSVSWDAGNGSRGHRIEAVLHLSDGSSFRTHVRTTPLRINQVEAVDLVNLYPIVRTQGGRYIADLSRDDFRIYENGALQQIKRFSAVGKPLRIAIVLDTSYTMGRSGKLENARKAALGFLNELVEGDQAMVVLFSDAVVVAQELTSDRELLAAAIQNAKVEGGTALYDAIWRTSRKLQNYEGRRVLLLLSDGKDEAANGFEPGSLHTLEEAVDRALRSEVMVFSIGLGRNLDHDYARVWSRPLGQTDSHGESLASILTRVGETTGGRALFSPSPGQLRRAFRDVADDLRHQYSIAYSSDDTTRDGKWRKIHIETVDPDLTVIGRKGYFASSAGESESTH